MPKLLGALHAAEHALISLLPLWAMCDRWDIGGLSTNLHFQTGLPTVFVYDGHAGGVGITERGFDSFAGWVADTARLLAGCPCTSGCPSCVQSPKCGNLNEMLDKARRRPAARADERRADARCRFRRMPVRRHGEIVKTSGERRQRGVSGTGVRQPGRVGASTTGPRGCRLAGRVSVRRLPAPINSRPQSRPVIPRGSDPATLVAAYEALLASSTVARLNHAVATRACRRRRARALARSEGDPGPGTGTATATPPALISCGASGRADESRDAYLAALELTEDGPRAASSNGGSARRPPARQNDACASPPRSTTPSGRSIELAAAAPEQIKGERLAAAQAIPHKFLENILADLRHGGLVASQRGAEGGYRLARPPDEITVADVIRVVEGPIASVRGERPDEIVYEGAAVPLRDVWIELRTAMRGVLEQTTLADLVERGRGPARRPISRLPSHARRRRARGARRPRRSARARARAPRAGRGSPGRAAARPRRPTSSIRASNP